ACGSEPNSLSVRARSLALLGLFRLALGALALDLRLHLLHEREEIRPKLREERVLPILQHDLAEELLPDDERGRDLIILEELPLAHHLHDGEDIVVVPGLEDERLMRRGVPLRIGEVFNGDTVSMFSFHNDS